MPIDVLSFIENLAVKVLFITEVAYDDDNDYVDKVRVKYLSSSEGQESMILERADVVALLKNGLDVLTLGITKQGETYFAQVKIYGNKYIRITPNEQSCDNLGESPPITRHYRT